MKYNRKKWQFINHPTKPQLSSAEVRYWKETMYRLLKVGLELEFNLPGRTGSCTGNDVACPCTKMASKCWLECDNKSYCENNKNKATCISASSKCKPDDCNECKDYKLNCFGTRCTDFISVCFTKCTKFEKNCDNCTKKYDKEKDPAVVRDKLITKFNPTNDYTEVNRSGVVKITKDGSLSNGGEDGVEIITVGRRINYWEFYDMSKAIIDEMTKYGAFLNERCGSHMHVLTSYYGNGSGNINKFITELEKTMPEVILANFHQLCRRYQNPITWMTMALDDPEHMTRWEKFRVSILDISPIRNDTRSLKDNVASKAEGHKYGWANYNSLPMDDSGDIEAFHVEMRCADSTMCPSYYAALACLYVAFAIKAVEISKYGVLKIGDGKDGWLAKAEEAKKSILNGKGSYDGSRVSNTSHALNYREYFIEEGMDMLSQMKGILMRFGPSYEVLTKLIIKPPALHRCEGKSWEEIEDEIKIVLSKSGMLENKLQEIIDLNILSDCEDINEWTNEATNILKEEYGDELEGVDKDDVEKFTKLRMRDGVTIWSNSTGSVINV